MKKITKEKGKAEALNDIYTVKSSTPEKVEIFTKLKEKVLKFWQSERGLPYLVVVLGIIALIFGLWHSNVNIKGNFLTPPEGQSNKLSLNKGLTNQQLTELSLKDTDSDGLSDYDELYVFYTSPYLEDTDSDGINDKDEIAGGTDPNCPGKVCTEAQRPYKPETIKSGSTQPTTFEEILNQQTGQLGATPDNQQEVLDALSNLSANELRQMLIQAGAPESLLQGVSDEQLLQMAQDALRQQGL